MTNRTLGSLQVAALLVSASYGIGFLFGSGELAMRHGMAGSIYGVATALGMLILSAFAHRLWAAGVPIWELFGRAYGRTVQSAVALLSLIWMAGVLAAQLQGGLAVVELLGLVGWPGYMLVLAFIFGASRLDLRFASGLFALCLLASALVLAYALVAADGLGLYLRALPTFVDDLPSFRATQLLAITIAVGLLVCTGADYHQFVLAARRPWAAILGCALAGVALILISFLPPAVVVAMQKAGALADVADARQVVPWLLARVAGSLGAGADKVMLVALSAAALGSGAAILRAMSDALASTAPDRLSPTHPVFSLLALGLGVAVAGRGQGIVETMVSVNVIYIASIAVCFAALLRGVAMTPGHTVGVMATGFATSLAAYVAGWTGWLADGADIVSLSCGLGASIAVALCLKLSAGSCFRSNPGRGR
jgi:solute:Na+ symporter, SSS family